jgi:hypothetical protein
VQIKLICFYYASEKELLSFRPVLAPALAVNFRPGKRELGRITEQFAEYR